MLAFVVKNVSAANLVFYLEFFNIPTDFSDEKG